MYMHDFANVHTMIVHGGIFHSDDVCAVAYVNLLKKWRHEPAVRVIRTFKVYDDQTLENGFLVADIGNGKFDHHFPDNKKEKRKSGVPYAAFGLVAKEFHDDFLNPSEYAIFDSSFIAPLDYHDNKGGPNLLAATIGSFNRNWDDANPDTDARFMEAVNFAEIAIQKEIDRARSLAKAKQIAIKNLGFIENETVYLDQYVPISEFYVNIPEVKFVGSPAIRGGYQVVSVKDATGKNKKLFPKYLRGFNAGENSYNESGVNFCHSSGFMTTFKDKETAKEFMMLFENFKEEE